MIWDVLSGYRDSLATNAKRQRRDRISRVATFCSVLLGAVGLVLSVGAQAKLGATHPALVSEFASFNTPGVIDGRVEAIAVDGDTVFVGGTFTQIHDPLNEGDIINQPYLFAYSKSSGNVIRTFDPVLNNSVFTLETTGEGTGVFAAGVFTNINGESRRALAKLDNNGDRVSGFGARPDAAISAMVRLGNTLYIGGNFSTISGTNIERLAALDTATGAVDPSLNFDFGGVISTTRTQGVQGVDELDVTSDGELMVVVGNFTSIDGISRTRLAVIELEGQASVSTWNTDDFDIQCPASRFPQYILGMDISPDDSYFVMGTTGFRFANNPVPACDTVTRYDFGDLTATDAEPTWVNYTGGDSVFEVVSTGHTVYAGGHFEFLDNDFGAGNTGGPGSTQRAGLAALDPLNGLTIRTWQSDRSPRGIGVFALLSDDEGLYMGDDTNFLNGTEHKKLKFMPLSSNRIVRPEAPELPTTIISANGNALEGSGFNGTTFNAPMQLVNSGWQDARGGMFLGGKLFHADNNGRMWSSRFSNGVFQARTQVNMFGVTEDDWALSRLTGMFFDYELSRVYFTLQGNSRLQYIALTPDTPFFGNDVFEADVQGDIQWSDVSGMDVIDDHLYFARTNGTLYRADINGAAVVSGTTVAVSGPGIDGRNWDNTLITFLSDGEPIGTGIGAETQFEANGSQTMGRVRSFEFEMPAGEPVELRLEWADSSAQVNLFIRDPNNNLVASNNSAAGSPKFVTVPAGAGGTYVAKVIVKEGSTSYTLQVNPDEGAPPPPAPLADFEFSSTGSNSSGRYQRFEFDVAAGELVEAQVLWDDPTNDVRVFLRDASGTRVDRDTDGGSPINVSAISTDANAGTWTVDVRMGSANAVNYDILVDTTAGFTPPAPLAEFEFSSTGSNSSGRYQRFEFDVAAGELVEAQVLWDDPTNDVRVFLRDASGTRVDRDTDGGSPINVSAISTDANAGTWTVDVRIGSNNAVNYDVLVDTTAGFTPPEPLADFEFNSTGSDGSGRYQRFRFDVAAGETVAAQVLWDAPTNEVRVFLRDASGERVDRNIDENGSPVSVSAIATAANAGRWSVDVRVGSVEAVNYDVLVDTTP